MRSQSRLFCMRWSLLKSSGQVCKTGHTLSLHRNNLTAKYMVILEGLTILAPCGTKKANLKLAILMDENYLHYSFILGLIKVLVCKVLREHQDHFHNMLSPNDPTAQQSLKQTYNRRDYAIHSSFFYVCAVHHPSHCILSTGRLLVHHLLPVNWTIYFF